jgi:GNAT superfamily N-acetyltransferase
MASIVVQLGTIDDLDAAMSVYERSNLARRQGMWPGRAARLAQVRTSLHDEAAWCLIGRDNAEPVAMAHVVPFRAAGGTGNLVAGSAFLNLIYVLPDRWGMGIGGVMLDAVIAEAERRGCRRIVLWTHERENERAQRLYRSRRFAHTGRSAVDDAGASIGEWLGEFEPLRP